MGCADALAARAINQQVADDIRSAIGREEEEGFKTGKFRWVDGNIVGGLTSVEEKSYGALAKSGTQPLQGLLREYEPPPRKGYWIQDRRPGSSTFMGDPEGINQFAACGAHLAMFTTGCGTTTGGLIPVIKVMANLKRMDLIRDNVDCDTSPIIRGEKTVQEMGEDLYREVLAVAAGKATKSEVYRHFEA